MVGGVTVPTLRLGRRFRGSSWCAIIRRPCGNGHSVGAWPSLVGRIVRDDEVGGSNPLAPTKLSNLACEIDDGRQRSVKTEVDRIRRELVFQLLFMAGPCHPAATSREAFRARLAWRRPRPEPLLSPHQVEGRGGRRFQQRMMTLHDEAVTPPSRPRHSPKNPDGFLRAARVSEIDVHPLVHECDKLSVPLLSCGLPSCRRDNGLGTKSRLYGMVQVATARKRRLVAFRPWP